MDKALEKKSRYLSKILRHDPGSADVVLDEKGWAKTNRIMDVLKINKEELETIVRENDKQRFELSNDKLKVRARQGHSIEVDVDLEDVTEGAKNLTLFHGTKTAHIRSILTEGLQKMSRQHVHLTADFNMAAKRAGKDGVVLSVTPAGLPVWKSRNSVYLMDEVPPSHIRHEPQTGPLKQ
jgi:putative RNA 2'-phosphotransferase